MVKTASRGENLRGSPEAIEKRRAARKLNRLLTEGSGGASVGDGRTERRRVRLLRELEEGTRDPREGLKPIEILQRAHDLLELGETLTSLRKVIRVHPRPAVNPAEARALLVEIQTAYGFRAEIFEFLGLPEEVVAAARPEGEGPRRRGRPRGA
jgi:hypothetical protein